MIGDIILKNNLTNNAEILTLNPEIQEIINSITSEYTLSMKRMTHEINNALTLISSSLQIIESSHPEVRGFKYWDTTMSDIHYLINLISEISYFNNSSKLSPEPTDIITLTNNIVNSFKTYKNAGDLDISVKSLTPIPTILCDKTKIKQVLINLIKNSYEAIETIDTSSFIHIILSYNKGYVSITVRDNGCGINPEQLENIFTPMISYKTNGNGLGLPISRKIIEAHGGTLTVKSTASTGTSFLITLPA